ncbi:hypothetical protein B0H10DRAFT_1847976 [Mycena sp. CBHHK59/15]|nr:hypothetical protein B0H10DRAFT_1847976 [Mycena sp. CBHHK59/15]
MFHDRNFTSSSELAGQLDQILQPDVSNSKDPLKPLTGLETGQFLAKGKDIPPNTYRMLSAYLHSIGQIEWKSYKEMPHLDDELALPPTARMPSEFKHDGHTFSCKTSHEGNSAIQFKHPTNPTAVLTGYINEIWQIPLQNYIQTFMVVEKHTVIPQYLVQQTPYPSMPYFYTPVVDANPSGEFMIIEPEHILTHLTVYKRPKGTYGIEYRDLLIICWALNHSRRT